MNRTNKKGFTLVELLVVIAILAILATVSVVGYTAFIERASVSNDENVAAQLNQFLTAMKADSTGDYYEELNTKGITPENVWKIIDAVLTENGTLTDLDPQSKDYGYHYFFKFNKDGENYKDGEIVVAKDEDIIHHAKKGYLAAHAAGTATDDYGVGFFTAKDEDNNDILYFFLDTKGSDLATAVNAFQQLSGWSRIDGVDNTEKLKNIIEAVENVKTECGDKADYTDKLNGTRFATSEGQLATNENANKNIIVVEDNATIGATVKVIDGKDNATAKPIDNTTEITITIPAGTKVASGAITVSGDGSKITIVIETDKLDTVVDNIEKDFTNAKTEIKDENDKSYTVDNDGKIKEGENDTGKALKDGIFKLAKFDIVASGAEGTVYDGLSTDNEAYAVYGNSDLSLSLANCEGEGGSNMYSTKVSWSVSNGYADYVDINEEGKITFKKTPVNNGDGYIVKFTATPANPADGCTAKEITINVIYTLGADFKVNSKDASDSNTIVYGGKSDISTNVFNISAYNVIYTYNSITGIDYSSVLNVTGDDFTSSVSGTTATITPTINSGNKSLTINLKVNEYSKSLNVNLFDTDDLPVPLTNLGKRIKYLGNDASTAVELGELFNLAKLPAGAQLVVYGGVYTDDKFNDLSGRGELQSSGSFSVSEITTITDTTKLIFTGTRNDEVSVTILLDGVRISDDVTFKVVNGKNIANRNSAQVTIDGGTSVAQGSEHHVLTSNSLVLLDDYTMPSGGYIDLATGCTIYGNMHTLDCTNARNNTAYVIGLRGTAAIQDIKILGKDFGSNVNDPWDSGINGDSDTKTYTASMVSTLGGATPTITNAYISGGRSPLRTRGPVTVKDTVLFGGAYSNLDIQDGNYTVFLTNVVTVNQGNVGIGESNFSRIGGGIVVANSAAQAVTIKLIGDFRQYNFVGDNETDKLMSLTGVGLADDYSWGKMFPDTFGDKHLISDLSEPCKDFRFQYKTGTAKYFGKDRDTYRFYMNPGIIFLKLNNGSGEVTSDKIKIFCGDSDSNLTQKYPNNYGGVSYKMTGTGMTAVSTLNTFNNMNNNKDAIEAYRAEAIKYKPGNCTADFINWKFTYTAN